MTAPDARRLPAEVHFSDEHCVILADMNSALQRDYLDLYHRYPYADGLRDIAICNSSRPTDAEALVREAKGGGSSWIGIGWLLFITGFANAARRKGMSAREYADWIYDLCERTNRELGYRAAWIEAYGEIGNSVTWPKGRRYSKRESLEYFRAWLRDGRSLTEHWRRVAPAETISYYSHARSRTADLRSLPIYYSEGTLFSLHEAYRNGFPLVVYEGQCGTFNAIQTGIAFVRGGARMYDALWGLDYSAWNGEPLGEVADVTPSGTWREGMTADYMYRTWLTGYLAGCNSLLHEVGYCFFYATPAEGLTIPSEFGWRAMQFYGLRRGVLEDRGKPVVPFAIMLEEEHGYRGDMAREYTASGELGTAREGDEPGERLWIWQNRPGGATRGDWAVHRMIQAIWPLPETAWGLHAQGWPDQALPPIAGAGGAHEMLAELRVDEKDPREYNRFLADDRWSECFDVVIETAPPEVLSRHYRVLLLVGDVCTDGVLWARVSAFLHAGGVVVCAVENLDAEARKSLGLELGAAPAEVRVSAVVAGGLEHAGAGEELSLWTARAPGMEVWARGREGGAPLVLRGRVGQGELYLTLFSHGMDRDARRLGAAYRLLIDSLHERYVGVTRQGPGCQMLVNARKEDLLVTLLNARGSEWRGTVTVERAGHPAIEEVRDLVADEAYPARLLDLGGERVGAEVRVPAYGTKILSFGPRRERRPRLGVDTKTPAAVEDQAALKDMTARGPLDVLGIAPEPSDGPDCGR